MAVSDFYTVAEKQWIKILTIDPRSRRVEGQLRDGAPVQISLYEIPAGFRWPKEGEYWLVYRENREWFLRAPMQAPDASLKVEDLNPGDSILGAEGSKVYVQGELTDASGKPYLTEDNLPDIPDGGFTLPDGQWITGGMVFDRTITDRVLADLAISQRHLKTRLIDSQHLVDEAVKSVHIALSAIDTQHLQDELITSAKLVDAAVTSIKLNDGSVLESKLADNAISTAKLQDQLITTAKLVDGAVTDAKVVALAASKITGQLTDAQLASIAAAKLTGQITETQISDNAISTPKLAAGSVVAAKIAADTITASEIAANAITAAEISAGAVTTAKVAAGAITANEIGALAVTTAKLDAGAVTAAKIAADTITANEIGANAITTSELAAGAVTAAKITAGTITANEIASLAITTAKLDVGAVTAQKIYSGGIQADLIQTNNLAANSIKAGQIDALAVTTAKIDVGAVTSQKIYSGDIQADRIQSGNIAALAITAGKIDALAVGANEIAANAITATKIAAGAITANKLNIVIPIISPMANGNFQDGTNGWTYRAGNTFSVVTDTVFGNVATINNPTATYSYSSQDVVLPKGRHIVTCHMKTANISGEAALNCDIVGGTGTGTQVDALMTGTNDWTLAETVVDVTSATATVRVYMQVGYSTATTGQAWFANFHIKQSTTGTQIIGGALDTHTITLAPGGMIRTSGNTADSRIVLDATNGLRHFNAGSTSLGNFSLTPAGNLTLAGSLTTGAGSSIDGQYITAASVTAAKIAAGSITAEKITVGAVSALANGSFEEGSTSNSNVPAKWRRGIYWGGNSDTAGSRSQVTYQSGAWAYRMFAGSGNLTDLFADQVPVSGGEEWTVSFWCRSNGTNESTSTGFYCRVYYSTTATPNSGEGNQVQIDIENRVLSPNWTRYTRIVTMPAGARWAAPLFLQFTTNSGAEFYIDDVTFTKAMGSTNIAGGAITASKLSLTMGGGNLYGSKNTHFNEGVADWVVTDGWALNGGASITWYSGPSYQSNGALQVTSTSSPAFQGTACRIENQTFRSGRTYTISCYVNTLPANWDAGFGHRAGSGSNYFVTLTSADLSAHLGGGWYRLVKTWTPTADFTDAEFFIRTTTATAHTWYVDGLQVEEGDVVTAYTSYGPGQVTGTNIQGGALDTHTITLAAGGKVRTANATERVELDSEGLSKYDSGGFVAVKLGRTDGLDLQASTLTSPPNDRRINWLSGSTRVGSVHTTHNIGGSGYDHRVEIQSKKRTGDTGVHGVEVQALGASDAIKAKLGVTTYEGDPGGGAVGRVFADAGTYNRTIIDDTGFSHFAIRGDRDAGSGNVPGTDYSSSLLNSFTVYSSSWAAPSVTRHASGLVRVQGLVARSGTTSSGTNILYIGTLYPCLDNRNHVFAVQSSAGMTRVDVTSSGYVQYAGAAATLTWLSLEGIVYASSHII